MSTTSDESHGVIPEACGSARQYAVRAVEESDTPLGAKELSREYGCTKDHMQHMLSDAVDDGEIERIALGRYASEDVYNEVEEENEGDDDGDGESGSMWAHLDGEDEADGQQDDAEEHGEGSPEMGESGEDHASVPTDAPSADGDATDFADPDGAGPSGIPAGAVVAIVVVGVTLYLVTRSSSTSSSSSGQQRSASTPREEMDRTNGGGLSG